MLLAISHALKQAMEYWALLGLANSTFDCSDIDLASIQPHSQNSRNKNWSLLIELCRDLWNETFQINKVLALTVLEVWKTIPFPIFKRLIFHAYTISDIVTPTEKLDYLLAEEAYWLWSSMTEREKFRLLAKLCPLLSHDDLIRLQSAILAGVPAQISQDYFNPERMQERNNREIWLHLAKLESFGVALNDEASVVYKQLKQKHPYWELQEGERDEFSFWMGRSQRASRCDLTVSELVYFSTEECINKLLEVSNEFFEGRIDAFRSLCKQEPGIALEILKALAKQSEWNTSVWHAGLSGLSDSTNPLWVKIAPLIIKFPEQLFQKEAWVIAWWVQSAIKLIEVNSKGEAYFWKIFDLLITHSASVDIKRDKIISQAINHPIGILTDVLINQIAARKINNKEKIVDKNILFCLEHLLNSDSESLLLAQVVLLSRLEYFHAIDPEWSQVNLIPLLDWDASNDAALYWQGYLSNPRISVELALDIKIALLTTLQEHTQELGKASIQIFQLFAILCLEFEKFYTVKEQKSVLNSISMDGLIEILRFVYYRVEAGSEKNDLYWKHRVEPFFKRAWPKDAKSLNPKIIEYFALFCIALDSEFESAVKNIKIILMPFKCEGFFLTKLKDSKHIVDHPLSAFDIFQYVRVNDYDIPLFKEIFITLGESEPCLKKYPKYKEIEDFLIDK